MNESRILEKELRKTVGRGRSATKNRVGEEKSKRMTMASEIAQKLNVGTTQLKQIQSIARYDESLLTKVGSGELSVLKTNKFKTIMISTSRRESVPMINITIM